jgi:hypothetical protein
LEIGLDGFKYLGLAGGANRCFSIMLNLLEEAFQELLIILKKLDSIEDIVVVLKPLTVQTGELTLSEQKGVGPDAEATEAWSANMSEQMQTMQQT